MAALNSIFSICQPDKYNRSQMRLRQRQLKLSRRSTSTAVSSRSVFHAYFPDRLVDDDFRNNSEIYLASIAARPEFGSATVLNAASQGREPKPTRIAPGSIATIRGNVLAFRTEWLCSRVTILPSPLQARRVTVNGQPARIFYASPDEVVFAVQRNSNGPAEFVVTN